MILLKKKKKKKKNYKGFYKEPAFKTFFKGIDNSEDVIKRANDLRNANPMSHASAGLIDKATTSQELKNV